VAPGSRADRDGWSAAFQSARRPAFPIANSFRKAPPVMECYSTLLRRVNAASRSTNARFLMAATIHADRYAMARAAST
jgi:hypothetical protein